MINKLVSVISVSVMAATLVACGGGGNSGGSAPLPIVGGEGGGESSQNPPVVLNPAPATGLDRLLGTVTLSYRFTGDTTVFTASTRFSDSSYGVTDGGNRVLRAVADDRAIVCSALPANGVYEYVCALVRSTDGSGQVTSQNGFLFSLTSNSSGSGVFEFCSGAELIGSACVDELISRPDGPLSVSITGLAKASGAATVDGIQVTDAELDVFQSAVEAEFGGGESIASTEPLSPEVLAQTYRSLLDVIQ